MFVHLMISFVVASAVSTRMTASLNASQSLIDHLKRALIDLDSADLIYCMIPLSKVRVQLRSRSGTQRQNQKKTALIAV